MALDKQFLKYKLEKIKNDRIFKDQDSETKKRIRKENSKLAQEEADAIHSYLTGEDNIDIFDNKSYLENRLPGGLYLTDKGQLNIIQSQDDPKTKKSKLRRIMRKFRSIHKANLDFSKQLKIFRRIFDSLNIKFRLNSLSIGGNLKVENDETVGGNLKVEKDETVGGNLKVEKDETVGGNLEVNGTGTIVGDLFLRNFQVGPNGYTYLPNGILIQWGIDTSDTDGNHTITFPIPFPNNCFSVSVNHKLTGGWNTDEKYGYPITAASYDTNGFVTNRNNAASATINLNYMAIGN